MNAPDLRPGPVLAPGGADTARFYREILDELDDQIVRFSTSDLTVRYCNPAWAERFGVTVEELIGRPVDLPFDDQERAGMFGSLEQALRERTRRGAVLADHVLPDGTVRHELWQDHLLGTDDTQLDFMCTGRDVTSLASARAELAASEVRHRRLVEDLALPAYAISHDGIILFVNRMGASSLGAEDPSELVGRPWEEMMHPTDHARLMDHLGDDLVAERSEVRMTDGRGGWWLADGAAVETVFDGIPAALVVQRDITAQRAAEEQLVEVERREFLMLNSLAEAVLLHDQTGRITFANMRAAEMFGESEPEMLLGLHTDTWLSDGIDASGNPLGRTGLVDPVFMTGEARINLEFRLATPGVPDEFRWLRASAMPIDSLDANQPSGVVCSIADITVERSTREALEASETRFRGVVENLAEGLIVLAEDGKFVSANGAAERILGRTESMMRATGVVDPSNQVIDEDGRTITVDELPAMITLRTGQSIRGRVLGVRIPSSVVFRGQRAQDDVRWLSVTTQPLEEGGQRHVVVLFSDITDRRRAEQALEHQANHDMLTGLPNRARLMTCLAEVIGRPSSASTAVMFLDLDHFKPVNDRYGHEAGDELLRAVAGRLSARVREGDTVARVGGDEFVVIAHGLADGSATDELAHRLRDDLRRPFRLRAAKVSIDASIGVVCAAAFDSVDALLASADTAMYQIKQSRPRRH